jgi:hypothetical protein
MLAAICSMSANGSVFRTLILDRFNWQSGIVVSELLIVILLIVGVCWKCHAAPPAKPDCGHRRDNDMDLERTESASMVAEVR